MKSIKSKLIIFVSGVTILLFALQMIFSSYNFYTSYRQEIEDKLKFQAEKESNYLNSIFAKFEELSVNYAAAVASVDHYDEDTLFTLFEKSIQKEPMLVGGGHWLEPYEYDETRKFYGPYMYKEGNEVKLSWDYSTGETDYFQFDWYQNGIRSNGKSVWSEPYADAVTGVPMLTITSPIVIDQETKGVITLDIGIAELQDHIANLKVGENGYAFLLTREGYYLGHRNQDYNLNRKITEESNEQLVRLGERIQAEAHMISAMVEMEGEDYYIIANPVGNSGLTMMMVLPYRETFAQVFNMLVKSIAVFAISILLYVPALERLLTQLIVKPLLNLKNAFEKLSNYDLTSYESAVLTKYGARQDEIGLMTRAMDTMKANFISLIKNIMGMSEELATASELLTATSKQASIAAGETAKTIEEIAYGANDQAKETEQGSADVNALGKLIEMDRKHVQELNTCADEVDRLKAEGMKSLEELVEINHVSANAAQEIREIITNANVSAEKIATASEKLEDILNQTNLLALNAAIEAARAGAAGKGFAVVAEEIRKLAEQSNAFTSEIHQVIQELTQKTGHAVQITQEVTLLMASQTENVDQTNEKFQGIAGAIENMKQAIQMVNTSSAEMEKKKQQIIQVIENLSAIAQENAAGTEEASASVEEQAASMEQILKSSEALTELAEEMQESIKKFKL